MHLEFIRDSLRLRRIKGGIKSGFGMGIQMVQHEANLFHMGIRVINEFFDKVRPIHVRALLRHFGRPLPCSWFKSHKNVCGPVSLLLGVVPQELPRLSWQRGTHFPKQLRRQVVHTHLGALRIIRGFRDISDCFHLTGKGGILLWGNAPCFLVPGFKFAFFQVRRMVSGDTEAIISNSTILSARLRHVHRSCPSGA